MEVGKRPQTEEQRQKQTISRFKGEDFKLREELKIVKEENRILKEKLEKALLLIEELQRMIFKKKGKEDKNNDTFDQQEKSKQSDRPASSYRRQAPKEEEITKEEECKLDCCPDCHNELTKLKTSEFFIEDVLPPQEWYEALKEVTRRKITTGYCAHCEKRITPVSIPKQRVSLGENIRELIVFQSTVQQLSYSQIIDFSQAVLHIDLSEGELAHILQTQSLGLESSYAVILKNIRLQKVVHMDETGWPTHKGEQGNFAWVVCSAKSEDVAYSLGRSRGKGNIEKLLGKNYDGIGITDNYGGYKNAFTKGHHALCWAHPFRKIRDLKDSKVLDTTKQQHLEKVFVEFKTLYEKVREINLRPFIRKEREQAVKDLSEDFNRFTHPHLQDPEKLKRIKSSLKEQKDCYFVCLLEPFVSPDNNKAERALRHLVIKRKKSFGCKTQKGADALSILYSVVMSLWRRSKQDFFKAYRQELKPLV